MLHLGVAHSLIHKNNTHEIYSTLQCFDNMFHVIYAHEWMNDAHVHEMQVQLGKPNTRGVTKAPTPIETATYYALTLIEKSSQPIKKRTTLDVLPSDRSYDTKVTKTEPHLARLHGSIPWQGRDHGVQMCKINSRCVKEKETRDTS